MNEKINDFIVKKVWESNGKLTTQLSNAIYILTDGTLIDGNYDENDIRTK